MAETDNQTLVAQILSSYLANNAVSPADLPSVIESVRRNFGGAGASAEAAPRREEKKREPAIAVRKSVTPDAVYCLCCGGKFKTLRRHLQTEHQLTPQEYRAAFNLKGDHPIVAPNYAAQRSNLAKSLGLGRKPTKTAAPAKKNGARKSVPKKAAE